MPNFQQQIIHHRILFAHNAKHSTKVLIPHRAPSPPILLSTTPRRDSTMPEVINLALRGAQVSPFFECHPRSRSAAQSSEYKRSSQNVTADTATAHRSSLASLSWAFQVTLSPRSASVARLQRPTMRSSLASCASSSHSLDWQQASSPP